MRCLGGLIDLREERVPQQHTLKLPELCSADVVVALLPTYQVAKGLVDPLEAS
jgi:hypothetical protein